MMNTIVNEKLISFKELEIKIFDYICELGSEMTRIMLERYDVELREGRNCPTAHCGRREQHFSVGAFASPTVRFGRQLQTLNGVTAHCRSLI